MTLKKPLFLIASLALLGSLSGCTSPSQRKEKHPIRIVFIDSFKKDASDSHGKKVQAEFLKTLKEIHSPLVTQMPSDLEVIEIEISLESSQETVTAGGLVDSLKKAVELDSIDLINVSAGVIWERTPTPLKKELLALLEALSSRGTLIVAAAGSPLHKKKGNSSDFFPGNQTLSLTIGALLQTGGFKPEITAPGKELDFVEKNPKGTSFAAARFSAKLAELVHELKINSSRCAFSLSGIRDWKPFLIQNAKDLRLKGHDVQTGYGELQIERAKVLIESCRFQSKKESSGTL